MDNALEFKKNQTNIALKNTFKRKTRATKPGHPATADAVRSLAKVKTL
jgi:hypothetical protein